MNTFWTKLNTLTTCSNKIKRSIIVKLKALFGEMLVEVSFSPTGTLVKKGGKLENVIKNNGK